MSLSNIAIAGAGLVGRLLAWRLLEQGHSVTLFEQSSFESPKSAAHTAAAMISPMSEVVVSERSIYDMGIQSLSIWPDWIRSLNLRSRQNTDYCANGSIVVAHEADKSELDQFYSDLCFHLGADNNARWLQQDELARKEPDLSTQFAQALYLPGEAFLDNRALLQSLLEAIRDLGGVCREQCEVSFEPEAKVDGAALTGFDRIIDCRGFGARQSNRYNKGDIRGVRGEVLWVQTSELSFKHPIRLVHPRYKLYVVPKPNNCFIIGATEIESQDLSSVSVQSTLELCSALYTLNPAFAEARIVEMDANLRPSYIDNLPMIDEETIPLAHKQNQRVIRINGLYRHGYLLAPALVKSALARIN